MTTVIKNLAKSNDVMLYELTFFLFIQVKCWLTPLFLIHPQSHTHIHRCQHSEKSQSQIAQRLWLRSINCTTFHSSSQIYMRGDVQVHSFSLHHTQHTHTPTHKGEPRRHQEWAQTSTTKAPEVICTEPHLISLHNTLQNRKFRKVNRVGMGTTIGVPVPTPYAPFLPVT